MDTVSLLPSLGSLVSDQMAWASTQMGTEFSGMEPEVQWSEHKDSSLNSRQPGRSCPWYWAGVLTRPFSHLYSPLPAASSELVLSGHCQVPSVLTARKQAEEASITKAMDLWDLPPLISVEIKNRWEGFFFFESKLGLREEGKGTPKLEFIFRSYQ